MNKIERYVRNPRRIPVALAIRLARMTDTTIPLTAKLKTGGSMLVLLPETVSVSVAHDGDFEPDVTEMMRLALKDERSPVFYDVGAHFGLRCVQAHAMREGRIQIVAFEPHPRTMAMLDVNTHRLKFRPGSGIVRVQKAVGASEGLIDMTDFTCQYSGSNTLHEPRLPADVVQSQPQKRIFVEMTTLDRYESQGGPTPTIIKFDIENGERDALVGSERILQRGRPKVIMEVGDEGRTNAQSTRECLKLLGGHGYGFYRVDMESRQLERVRATEFSGGRGLTVRSGQDNLLCVHEVTRR